ncbi:MAG: hypothetical protein H6636_05970 [Anaerolineales bacterium]|nr:hypothetical protein [Anaerolineales bacterium]
MKQNRWLIYFVAFLLVMACQIASPTPPPTVPAPPTETLQPSAIPLPTNTPTPEPTQPPTETPTTTPEPLLLDEIYHSPEGGFSVQLPATWKLIEDPGQILFAAPDERSATGPRFSLIGMLLDAPTTLEDYLNDIIAQAFDGGFPEGNEYTMGEPTELTIGGVPGLSIEFTGPFAEPEDSDLTIFVIVALPNDHQSFIMASFSPTERWNDDVAPLYNAMRETVTFFNINK